MEYERVSVGLQFSTLIVVVCLGFAYLPPRAPPEIKGPGRLSLYVERFVSELKNYDVTAPNLFLEVEAAGVTRTSTVHYTRREVPLKQGFTFDNVDYQGAIMLRIRDAAVRNNVARGLFVTTPSEARLNRSHVYRIDDQTFIVMTIKWESIKGGQANTTAMP